MLLAVAVDPTDVATGARLERDLLLDTMLRFGILASSEAELQRLKTLFLQFARSDWQRWSAVIEVLPRVQLSGCVREMSANQLMSVDGLDALYVAGAEIVNRWLEDLEGDRDSGCVLSRDGTAEGVRLDSLLRSGLIRLRESWATEELPGQVGRDVVWDRLEPLFRSSEWVHIVDRYVFDCASSSLHAQPAANGVEWLFERIGELKLRRPLAISLYGEDLVPPFDTAQYRERLLDRLWERSGQSLRELVLRPSPDRMFRNMVHHRSIRFATEKLSRRVTLDNSWSAFNSDQMRMPLTLTYRVLSAAEADDARRLEERLARLSDRAGSSMIRRSR